MKFMNVNHRDGKKVTKFYKIVMDESSCIDEEKYVIAMHKALTHSGGCSISEIKDVTHVFNDLLTE